MDFTQLIQSLKQQSNTSWSATIPDEWMQGRTTYGGLSAALCLEPVLLSDSELPPLRSAQINFIGPTGGDVIINTKVLRQGKSVTFIGAEIIGEKGLATKAIFCFGARRESKLDKVFGLPPKIINLADAKQFTSFKSAPTFTKNFECLSAKTGLPNQDSNEVEMYMWARHKDQNASGLSALLGVADIPPPAVLPLFKHPAPISSMTWMMNFISDAPTTDDRWWLMRASSEHAKDGYSSQDLTIWNASRELVVTGRQNMAIFY